MYKFKNDKYKKARGGYSRLLDISCSECGKHICFYQKDGPGLLKRMYLDRISGLEEKNTTASHPDTNKDFLCSHCDNVLGKLIIYKKENRPAYRLFVDSVTKKISKRN